MENKIEKFAEELASKVEYHQIKTLIYKITEKRNDKIQYANEQIFKMCVCCDIQAPIITEDNIHEYLLYMLNKSLERANNGI